MRQLKAISVLHLKPTIYSCSESKTITKLMFKNSSELCLIRWSAAYAFFRPLDILIF
ncbi:MAG: hypothetical protein ACJA19_001705 [Bacteroidia bacterium]|jgi:hypothetical protein